MTLKFRFEQLAICPPADKVEEAKQLLVDTGLCNTFTSDHVVAIGSVFGDIGKNEADLAFNYDALKHAEEFEILHYTTGANWMAKHGPSASHLGMHCTAAELEDWRSFFAQRGIGIAQEVRTVSHTNPHIANKRWYQYTIFDTRPILGIDLKFIVRLEEPR